MTILIWIALVSLLALAGIIGVRISHLRQCQSDEVCAPSTFFSDLQKRVDHLALLFVLFCRDGLKYVFLQTLIALKKAAVYVKVAGLFIEKRFEKVINLVRGKGEVDKKGAVSFFLREIAEHKTVRPRR